MTSRRTLALATLLLAGALAGCARTTTTQTVAPPPAHQNPAHCVTSVVLDASSNGSSSCVKRGGHVEVALPDTPTSSWGGLGIHGTSLTVEPVPTPEGVTLLKATSAGVTVFTSTHRACPDGSQKAGTQKSCSAMTRWTATVTVT